MKTDVRYKPCGSDYCCYTNDKAYVQNLERANKRGRMMMNIPLIFFIGAIGLLAYGAKQNDSMYTTSTTAGNDLNMALSRCTGNDSCGDVMQRLTQDGYVDPPLTPEELLMLEEFRQSMK